MKKSFYTVLILFLFGCDNQSKENPKFKHEHLLGVWEQWRMKPIDDAGNDEMIDFMGNGMLTYYFGENNFFEEIQRTKSIGSGAYDIKGDSLIALTSKTTHRFGLAELSLDTLILIDLEKQVKRYFRKVPLANKYVVSKQTKAGGIDLDNSGHLSLGGIPVIYLSQYTRYHEKIRDDLDEYILKIKEFYKEPEAVVNITNEFKNIAKYNSLKDYINNSNHDEIDLVILFKNLEIMLNDLDSF